MTKAGPTFPDFQSAGSNHTFTFYCAGINTPVAPHHRAAHSWRVTEGANLSSQLHSNKKKKTWPLELQLCSCWAPSVLSLHQVRDTHTPEEENIVSELHALHNLRTPIFAHSHIFLHCPAAQQLVDCCKSTSQKQLPLQVIKSFRIQDEGQGCDIKATV